MNSTPIGLLLIEDNPGYVCLLEPALAETRAHRLEPEDDADVLTEGRRN